MPTAQPRKTFTLTSTTAAQLSKLAKRTGHSEAAIVRDILEESLPVLLRFQRSRAQLEKLEPEQLSRVSGTVNQLLSSILQALGTDPDQIGEADPGSAASGARRPGPRRSNTGVSS